MDTNADYVLALNGTEALCAMTSDCSHRAEPFTHNVKWLRDRHQSLGLNGIVVVESRRETEQ